MDCPGHCHGQMVILKPSLTPPFPHTHTWQTDWRLPPDWHCVHPLYLWRQWGHQTNLSMFQHRDSFQVRHVYPIDAFQGQGSSSHRATIGGGVQDTLFLWEGLHRWDHVVTGNETQGTSRWLSQTESSELCSCWSCLDRPLPHQMEGNHHSR